MAKKKNKNKNKKNKASKQLAIKQAFSDGNLSNKEVKKLGKIGVSAKKIQKKKAQYGLLKKADKQQMMKDAFADGEISKKEAKQLSAAGISQAKLQKNYNKQFKPGNVFSFDNLKTSLKPGTVYKTKEIEAPSYTPLQISPGAQEALPATETGVQYKQQLQAQQANFDKQFGAQASLIENLQKQLNQLTNQPAEEPVVEEETGPTVEEKFAELAANLQTSLEEGLAAQKTASEEYTAFQDEKLKELQDSLLQQQSSASAAMQLAGKPSVLGVKSAVSSAGTPMQIAQKGMFGNFGRLGMRIKSLNL